MNNPTTTIKYVSETFIKPNLENVRDSNQPYILSPWELRLLSINYSQLGLFFTKPSTQTFSFEELVKSLKHSLALTLVHFYPLLGQLTTQIDHVQHKCLVLVDLNKGQGAHFLHGKLDMTLSDLLSPTYIPEVVYSLFGDNEGTFVNFDGQFRPLLLVKVIELLDGVFIGGSVNHAIVDGISFDHFWNTWCEIHSTKLKPPSTISHPPIIAKPCFQHAFSYTSHPDEFVTRYISPPEMKSRIFHISTDSMRRIKESANNVVYSNNITISSFQALSALIWRTIVKAMGIPSNEVTNCILPVNVRKKLDPPLPEEYFGNISHAVVATTTVDELLKNNLGWVASLLHRSILNYDNKLAIGFVNHWLEKPVFANINKIEALKWVRIGGSPNFDRFSHKFGGLGAPIAIRHGAGNKFPGKVLVFRGYEGGSSVDVEITLMPESMARLESDHEFMDVVSLPDFHFGRSKM